MPDRIIHESATTSQTLDSLSDAAERTFWRLTTVADDYGCFDADPTILIAKVYPRRAGRMKPAAMERILFELASGEDAPVVIYRVRGRAYGHFVNWKTHQRQRASKPKFPLPDDPEADCGDPPRAAANGGEMPRAAARARTLGSRESRVVSREPETSRPGGMTPQAAPGGPLLELWREICVPAGFADVRLVDDELRRKERSRFAEEPDPAVWRETMARITRSSFCRGEGPVNGSKPWRADYRWLVANPANRAKVLEGKYDDHTANGSARGAYTPC